MASSRQRVQTTLNHQEPDRIPLDLGSSSVTGMHVSVVYRLRQALSLDAPGTPVKVIRPYLMQGEMDLDLVNALGVDVLRLEGTSNMFALDATSYKEWTTFDGTPVLVPQGFNTRLEPNGDLLQYPCGDPTLPPSGRMPSGGWYFDAIIRQGPIDPDAMDPEDNLEEFSPLSDVELAHYAREARRLYDQTDKAILGKVGGTAFGDIALVPATWLKHPRGIRDVAEWYMATLTHRDYVYRVFERQCELALQNLERAYQAVGDRISAIYTTGADFGMQTGPFISPQTYRDLYQPFHRQVNNWIHTHTPWRVFIHSCGSVLALLDDFIEAGFDILNPVQCSAAGMDPIRLKQQYGERIVFWGGGVDTQRTLPFGTPDDVRREVRERIRAFAPGGGFVFNPIHNVQPGTPVENLLAMFDAARKWGQYPIR